MAQGGAAPELHRVKLYKLNETGGWDDKGTGLVSVGPMECANHQSNTVGLCVISEETSKMLMVHRILQDDSYNRQDETIITWTDPDIGTDVALSFQEAQGCSAIWEHIRRAQLDSDPKHPDHRRRVIDEFDGAISHLDGDYPHHDVGEMGGGHVELPAAEMSNLEEIAQTLGHVPPMQRERVAQLLLMPGYLRKLLDLFRQCEDLEDTSSLQQLFRVMRSMIMLNDTQLLDELLKEEHVMDVIGCLEYDPELQAPQQHRQFLQTAVVFKEVVPITSQDVLVKIHQTYRIQYLKDVILPRSLDDATYATLSSLMLFNNVDVVLGLYQDSTFLPRLFHALKSHTPGDGEWDDLVAFLQEFCSLAKHLQLQHRQNLWNKMTQLGMFEVITRILQSSTAPVKLRATDILLSALAHDPLPLRNFLASNSGHQLLDCLVAEFVSSEDSGLPEQIAELLKLLVDPETMEGALDKSEFMEVFYNTCMDKLIAPVSGSSQQQQQQQQSQQQQQPQSQQQASPQGKNSSSTAAAAGSSGKGGAAGEKASTSSSCVPASTIGLIVDLLCFCVQHHAFWAKYHVLRRNVVEKVLRLLQRKERWLVVAGIRFLRTCIGTKDDFYLRHLIKNDLLEPVMNAFFENGDRYNLLNSAVLEMVEFIRKENLKMLIEYLVEKFGSRLDDITYVDTFKQLQLKFDQSKEAAEAAAAVAAGSSGEVGGAAGVSGRLYSSRQRRLRRDDRDLEKDEEDYFSEDSVEDDAAAGSGSAAADGSRLGPLPNRPAAAAAGTAAGNSSSGGSGSKDLGRRGELRLVIKGPLKLDGAEGGSSGGGSSGKDGGGGGSNADTTASDKGAVAAGAAILGPLVPYGDEDEDEENEPPPKAQKAQDGSRQQPGSSPERLQQAATTAGDHQQQHQQQRRQQKHSTNSMHRSTDQQQQEQGTAVSSSAVQQQEKQQQQLHSGADGGSPTVHKHSSQQGSAAASPSRHQQQLTAAAAAEGVEGDGGNSSPATRTTLSPDAAGSGTPPSAADGINAVAHGELTPTKRTSSNSSSEGGAAGSPHSPKAKRVKPAASKSPQQQQKHQQQAADAAVA